MNCVLSHLTPHSRTVGFSRSRKGLVAKVCVDSVFSGVLWAILIGSFAHAQQTTPFEKVYKHPQAEVERALRDMQADAAVPLPVLDGFVNGDSSTFDLYENPQYQFRIKVTAQSPEQTLVSVSARITAWRPNEAPSRSAYVLLPSNGRLEKDLLDHLNASLEKGSPRQPSDLPSVPMAPVSVPTGASRTFTTTSVHPSGAGESPVAKSVDIIAPKGDFKSADPVMLTREIAKVQAEREAVQQEEKKLQEQISELETDRNSRSNFSDPAMVKTGQAPIFERPLELSKILFRADTQDEFEVTEARSGWVHIRLEGLDQGWIKMSELQLPNEPDSIGGSAAADFSEPSEEVAPFNGNWLPLKDKPTLFVVAQPKHPISKDSLGASQITFAKQAFLDGYRASTHSQEKIVGVAVIFLGDKAGVAAATLADINQWNRGAISEKLFLERCSLSPPDAFRDAAQH